MDITQFMRMMHQKDAQQVIIAPNVPMQIFVGGKWQQTTLFTPSEHVINTMLQNCVPPNLQGSWRQENGSISFPYATAAGQYEIKVQSVSGQRTVTITDAASPPSTPAPQIASATTTLTATNEAGLSSPLKATSQIAREMGKGSVNIVAPPAPSTAAPVSTAVSTHRTPAAPPPSLSTPSATSPSAASRHAAPPNLPTVAWHYAINGQQHGPVSQQELQSVIAQGLLSRETMVWRDGMPDWAMAKLTELESLFKSQPPSFTPHSSSPGQEWHHNNSGDGWNIAIPPEIKGKWNWGAFCIPGFWAFAHGLPAVGVLFLFGGGVVGAGLIGPIAWIFLLVGQLLMGGWGNDLAWSFRKFDNLEEFAQVQRIWAWWGIGVQLTVIFLSVLAAASAMNNAASFH